MDTPEERARQQGVPVAEVIHTKRDLEAYLHFDLGFSRSESRRITAEGFERLTGSGALSSQVHALIEALKVH